MAPITPRECDVERQKNRRNQRNKNRSVFACILVFSRMTNSIQIITPAFLDVYRQAWPYNYAVARVFVGNLFLTIEMIESMASFQY
jgi:hypothetical protein